MLANMGIDSFFHFHQPQIAHLFFLFLSNTKEREMDRKLRIWGISFCALSKVIFLILISGNFYERGIPVEMETVDKVVDIDNNFMDPQFCATIACDIYKHLRASEVRHSFPHCIE